jgi:hypothetical protein
MNRKKITFMNANMNENKALIKAEFEICELRNPKGLARPAASAFCLKVLDGRKFR